MSEHTPDGFGPGEEIVPRDAEEFTPAAEGDGQARDDDPGPVTSTHEGPVGAVAAEAFPAPEDDPDAPAEGE